ncbi:hypothetical protein RI129_009438 [Pyrocoelia pectoralis]|uniref:Major facilitator superfamily (MFS) profile domain-containing protein n=1 Tax=Pyrocoelia pectoralis TaxID=417401 RepID=A0AAN7V9D6_9COLE
MRDNDYLKKNLFGRLKQLLATICLGPFFIGVSISWTSPVLPQLESNSSTFHLTKEESSWVGSVLGLGVLAAALPTGYLASRFGPKKCIIGLIIPALMFTIIVVFSRDVYSLCVARFLSGVATGGVCVVSPMYMSEMYDVPFRGTLGSFFEFVIYVGVVTVAITGSYVTYTTLTIMIGVIASVLTVVLAFLPESPSHLMKIDRREDAENALKFYTNQNCDVSETMMEIQRVIEKKQKHVSLKEALRSKSFIRGIIAAVGLTSFQKFCGVDSMIFYTVNIFQIAETGMNEYTSTIIFALVQLAGAVLNVFVVELANRRVFLFISSLGMSASLTVLGIYFHLKQLEINFSGIGIIPLATLVVYALSFAAGLGPVLWLINGELFASDVKGLANGIIMTTSWTLLTVVTKSFPIMLENLGANHTFYFFAVCMLACAIFVKFCVPETRGKTLEQIQIELES